MLRYLMIITITFSLNLQYFECILKCLEFHGKVVHQVFNLMLRIKYFNTLRVRIISNAERSGDCIRIFSAIDSI